MRVIAGEFRSRRLQAPRGSATRPTSDRLRETLFNVLGTRVKGARFVDLYAGSGAVGIEALSRGAAFVWFAENAPAALAAISANLAALKLAGGFAIEDRGAVRLLQSLAERGDRAEILFLDPPYEAAEEYRRTLQFLASHAAAVLAEGAQVIAEHSRKQPLKPRYTGSAQAAAHSSSLEPTAAPYAGLERMRVLGQGDAALSFYELSAGG